MAGWEDVRRLALSLPGTSERTGSTGVQWRVRDRLFVWERPLLQYQLRHNQFRVLSHLRARILGREEALPRPSVLR